jgi:predicted deacylase
MRLSIKSVIIVVAVFVALVISAFVIIRTYKKAPEAPVIQPSDDSKNTKPVVKVIGQSVEGRDITAYTYGKGKTHLLFAGGMHGGYEWNSVLLAYQFMDYVDTHPTVITPDLTVTVIPAINVDGVFKVTGKVGRFAAKDVTTNKTILAEARFNAHDVDLNRNFDCNWKPTSMWQSKKVSAGSNAFSEPEAVAIRNFVSENKPAAAVFWHSQANAVYASKCNKGILPQTIDIMNAYSQASKYPAIKTFDSYEITGDSEGWLASINIPAITVELQTHEDVEWERNLAGIKALLDYYSQHK